MFRINGNERRMALALRKRFLSHLFYTRIYQKLIDFCRSDYGPAIQSQAIRAMSNMMPECRPP